MRILLLVLITFFVIVNVAVEFLRKDLHPKTDPMSSYLTGRYGELVDASYLALGGAIGTLPLYLGAGMHFAVICWISTAAVFAVVLTKRLREDAPPSLQVELLHLHVLAAGIAFVSASILLLMHGWHDQFQFLIGAAAPASAALFARFKPNATAIEEKTYASLVLVGLIALVLSP